MCKIWWIDDEEGLHDIIPDLILKQVGIDYQMVLHWRDCKAKPGDIIVHDLYGVGEKKDYSVADKVITFVCSGSVHDYEKVDFPKPFDYTDIINRLKEAIKKQGE